MKISIIIPIGDKASYERCKASVLSSIAATNGQGNNSELIEIFDYDHKGVAWARNEGLCRASGDYIVWVDSDDEVSDDWFPMILKGLEENPDVLSFNARVVWIDGMRPLCTIGGLAYAADVMAERTNGQLWNKVIRQELYEGLTFMGTSHEDYRLLCELLPRATTFAHINKELYVYRRSANGLSQHRDIELARKSMLDLIEFCNKSPEKWKREIRKGVAQRAADFCRNAESTPELRRFIRKSLPSICIDNGLAVRVKTKCILASLGI